MRGLVPLGALLLLVGCTFEPVRQTTTALTGAELSIEKELEITADIHRQIRAQAPFISDPVVLGYLNEIGQEIVRATEPQPFVYRFSLLRADELNAFTIGGGYVYISSAVLAQAGDVSELAGVLGHEVAHVRNRHIARRQEGQGLATLATLAATAAVVLAGGDPGLVAIPQGINVAMQLKNSRANEAEADADGIDYMIRSNYDPVGMMRFFQRILSEQQVGGVKVPAYLYSHPALEERITATKVDLQRRTLPPSLRRHDQRLSAMQARLALLLSPVAGGSGLHARANFERGVTDPLLGDAAALLEAGDFEGADAVLARAQQMQPNDPRVPLARADIAERRGELEAARTHLEHAFELDPSVPLVQYRLGRIHKELGNRTRAVFYLEQAVTNVNPGSSLRQRAELEIEQLTFQALARSGLGTGLEEREMFVRGEEIRWWGELAPRIQSYNPEILVHWIGPGGKLDHEESVHMNPLGRVSSTLPNTGRTLELGAWKVRVLMGDSMLEERSFHVIDDLERRPSGTR